MGDTKVSIEKLNNQDKTMKDLIVKNLQRKEKYVYYDYKRASFKIDQSLNYLLSLIQDIDGGDSPEDFLKKNEHKEKIVSLDKVKKDN